MDQDNITHRRRQSVKTAIVLAVVSVAVFVGYIVLVLYSAA